MPAAANAVADRRQHPRPVRGPDLAHRVPRRRLLVELEPRRRRSGGGPAAERRAPSIAAARASGSTVGVGGDAERVEDRPIGPGRQHGVVHGQPGAAKRVGDHGEEPGSVLPGDLDPAVRRRRDRSRATRGRAAGTGCEQAGVAGQRAGWRPHHVGPRRRARAVPVGPASPVEERGGRHGVAPRRGDGPPFPPSSSLPRTACTSS